MAQGEGQRATGVGILERKVTGGHFSVWTKNMDE